LEAAIPSSDPELEATVAVQAAVIVELRAATAERAPDRHLAGAGGRAGAPAREGLLELFQAAVL
jgi:hypothetical protein